LTWRSASIPFKPLKTSVEFFARWSEC
jgi:hypothetical protein